MMYAPSIQTLSSKISKYLHPLTFVNISSWIVNIYVYHNPFIALINPVILLICLVPGIAYIKISKHKNNGIYNRTNAFSIILSGFFAAIFVFFITRVPKIIVQDASIAFLVIMITMVINRLWWDISFHAAIPMCCVALLLPVSQTAAITCLFLALMVGISRVPLKQHTWTQVLAGWLFGFSCTSALLFIASHV